MFAKKASAIAVFACLGAASLSGCSQSRWQSSYVAGQAALAQKPPQMQQAEKLFKAAVDDAYCHGIPEPQFAPVIQAAGETLMANGKPGEAQEFLLRTVSLATATHMNTMENVRMLKLLGSSYEQMKNYPQASQTADVLANYVATELSPLNPEYELAMNKQKKLKELAAACRGKHACCDAEKAKLASDQPAVAPSAD